MSADPAVLAQKASQPDRPLMYLGAVNPPEWVMVLHESLETLGHDTHSYNDGHFSAELDKALREMQLWSGLNDDDGRTTERTWATLAVQLWAQVPMPTKLPEPQPLPQPQNQDAAHQGQQHFDPIRSPEQAEEFMKQYRFWRNGGKGNWDDYDLQVFAWADHDMRFRLAYGLWEQAKTDNELVMWEDGSQSTRRQHREYQLRQAVQGALDVLTANSIGAITFGVAKAAGASDDTATTAGQMAGTAGHMAGAHAGAVKQAQTHPASTGGPSYGERPR